MSRFLFGLAIAATLCSAAPAQAPKEEVGVRGMISSSIADLQANYVIASIGGANPGQASHYSGNWNGGNCNFGTLNQPNGIHGTSISDKNWFNAGNCGSCLQVTGPRGNQVIVMVSISIAFYTFTLT
jgi:hypothetical protein